MENIDKVDVMKFTLKQGTVMSSKPRSFVYIAGIGDTQSVMTQAITLYSVRKLGNERTKC